METVSIVLPTYNRSALLARAIKAFQCQSFQNFGLYIYDNASTDGTRETVLELQKTDPRIHYFRHSRNIGPTENFLFGMRRIEDPYFAFASDDDVPLPNFLEVCLDGFRDAPTAMLSAGGTLEMTPAGDLLFAPLPYWPRDGFFAAGEAVVHMLGGNHPSWNTILFRREVLNEVGYFDPSFGLIMDLEYTLRVASLFPIVTKYDPCGIFIRHDISAGEHATAEIAAHYIDAIDNALAGRSDRTVKESLRNGLLQMMRRRLVESAVRWLARGNATAAYDCMAVYQTYCQRDLSTITITAMAKLPPTVLKAVPIIAAVKTASRARSLRSKWQLGRKGRYDLEVARTFLKSLSATSNNYNN